MTQKPWYIEARARAERFTNKIDRSRLLQFEISSHDGAWYLHRPTDSVNLKADRERLGLKAYVNKIDAYRTAVQTAIATDHRNLLLFGVGDYRPRIQVNGSEQVRIWHCNLRYTEERIVKELLATHL
ncbi:hypothetical protein [Methylococcus mesophilus]|uniref:hypothetical protein n=1 Tax=Methylococcus mesophilus TaxID=2993564 RepID=UPI00224A59F6|nr:hypothetical protein [Methylococcus mesophilus]UZR27869.1 hypothetical protein OOT43_14230 [Methylococcus mesophilus]